MYINIWENMLNQHVYGTLELWKGTKIYSVGKRIQQFITRSLKQLAHMQFIAWHLKSFMPIGVLAGANSKQVIKINTNQTKYNFITPKQIRMELSKF